MPKYTLNFEFAFDKRFDLKRIVEVSKKLLPLYRKIVDENLTERKMKNLSVRKFDWFLQWNKIRRDSARIKDIRKHFTVEKYVDGQKTGFQFTHDFLYGRDVEYEWTNPHPKSGKTHKTKGSTILNFFDYGRKAFFIPKRKARGMLVWKYGKFTYRKDPNDGGDKVVDAIFWNVATNGKILIPSRARLNLFKVIGAEVGELADKIRKKIADALRKAGAK